MHERSCARHYERIRSEDGVNVYREEEHKRDFDRFHFHLSSVSKIFGLLVPLLLVQVYSRMTILKACLRMIYDNDRRLARS